MNVISRWSGALGLGMWMAAAAMGQVSRLENTPHLLQDGFGPRGEFLPNDGLEYCVPTAFTMAFYWLRADGITRIAPRFSERNALSTDLALAGLFRTSPGRGTVAPDRPQLPAVPTYLALKGLGSVKVRTFGKPTAADIVEAVSGSNIGVINIAWVSAATLERQGGHDVTVVGAAFDAQHELVVSINNPMVPQTQVIPTTAINAPGHPYNGYLAFTGNILSKPKVLPVIAGLTILEPDPFAVAATAFRPAMNLAFAPTGGSLSVWAPIAGPKGVTKSGAGRVVFESSSRGTYHGRTLVRGGVLETRVPSGPALGRGDIRLDGGEIVVAPAGGGVAKPVLGTKAGRFRFGGGTLALRAGQSKRVTAKIAGQFTRGRAGSLIVAPSRGLAQLGDSESLVLSDDRAAGLLDDQGFVAPAVLGQDGGPAGAGNFLRYEAGRGFVSAGLDGTFAGGIGVLRADTAVGAGRTFSARALRIDGASVGGEGAVRLAAGGGGEIAGLILNGGRVEAGSLRLEAGETVVYASRDGGRIRSRIEGRGSLIVTGPGALVLEAANAYAGATTVNDGKLVVRNEEGSATAQGDVLVRPAGTLAGDGRIAGNLRVEGALQAGFQTGRLRVDGSAFFADGSQLTWVLVEMRDGTAEGGAHWGVLEVGGDLKFDGADNQFQTLALRFPPGRSPNRGDAFWKKPHRWAIAVAEGALDVSGLAVADPRFDAGRFAVGSEGRTVWLTYTPSLP